VETVESTITTWTRTQTPENVNLNLQRTHTWCTSRTWTVRLEHIGLRKDRFRFCFIEWSSLHEQHAWIRNRRCTIYQFIKKVRSEQDEAKQITENRLPLIRKQNKTKKGKGTPVYVFKVAGHRGSMDQRKNDLVVRVFHRINSYFNLWSTTLKLTGHPVNWQPNTIVAPYGTSGCMRVLYVFGTRHACVVAHLWWRVYVADHGSWSELAPRSRLTVRVSRAL